MARARARDLARGLVSTYRYRPYEGKYDPREEREREREPSGGSVECHEPTACTALPSFGTVAFHHWQGGTRSCTSRSMGKRSTKRRRQQRVEVVGAQVEESIRQDAEDKKLRHAESTQLFRVDSEGGDGSARLRKKQRLAKLQKDPVLASSRKWTATAKRNKGEALAIKRLQLLPTESTLPRLDEPKPVKELWGADGSVKKDERLQRLDEYVAPIVVTKIKRRQVVASTQYRVPTVEVAAAGQSYHPDFESHQDVMAEAVAEELERREEKARQYEPVSKGMSEDTLQHIKQESSSDSESACDSDDDDGNDLSKTVRDGAEMRWGGTVGI